MKQLFISIVVLALVVSFSALAEGRVHAIDEYNITLEIPDGYRLITPDIDENDPVLALYGITAADVRDMFEIMPLYMDAVKTDGSGEITVTIQDSDLPDYAEMGASLMEMLGDEMSAASEEMGIKITGFDVYDHAQMPFVCSYFESAVTQDSGVQYYTVWGGKSYSFALHTYAAAMSDADGAVMERMMESVKFNDYVPAAVEAESFVYTDSENGASFTVPAGWEMAEDSKKNGVEYAAFICSSDLAANIVYAADDIWEQYPALYKLFITRAGVNNSSTSKSDVADMFGASYSDVEIVTMNGIEYYRVEFSQTAVNSGLTYSINSTALLRNYNGSSYLFIYTGNHSSSHLNAFEELVSSASYPEISKGVAPIVIILPVLAAIAAVIIVFSVRAKRKRAKEREEEEARIRAYRLEELRIKSEQEKERQHSEQMKYVACPKCGNNVLRSAKFCGVCGNKLDTPGEE